MTNDRNDRRNQKETHDLFITVDKKEIREAQDVHPADDMADDEVFKSQHSDGHTFNPRRAAVEGLTYTPPTDPPIVPGDDPQGAEIAAGYSLSQDEDDSRAERLPERVANNDLDLRDRVYRALRQNSETGHLTHVKVQVQNAAVNLLGTVESQDDIAMVHEIVAQLEGVKAIKNNLQTEAIPGDKPDQQSALHASERSDEMRPVYPPQRKRPGDSINKNDRVDEVAWESFPASDAPPW